MLRSMVWGAFALSWELLLLDRRVARETKLDTRMGRAFPVGFLELIFVGRMEATEWNLFQNL